MSFVNINNNVFNIANGVELKQRYFNHEKNYLKSNIKTIKPGGRHVRSESFYLGKILY